MSRIIKSHWVNASGKTEKVISIRKLQPLLLEEPSSDFRQSSAIQQEMLIRAQAEAEMIVKEAEHQAQLLREQINREQQAWESEKAALMEEARQEGFAKGMAEGKEQGYNEYKNTILFAQEVVNAAKKDYQQQIASADKAILKIGIKVAEKILGERLENEERFLAVVQNALKEAREYQEVKLHVHPCQYEFLLARKDELAAIFPIESDLYIYPNDDLSETGCLIESANGRIDASVDSQLEEIKHKLLELLESEEK